MRNQFPEYYTPTATDFAALWADALFVLDANVLLDVYRFSPATTNQLFSVLEQLGERIWLPHQAALEYQRNRRVVSAAALDSYDKCAAKLDGLFKELQDVLNKNVDSEFFLKGVRRSFDSAKRKLVEAKVKHAKLVPTDNLDDRLAKLLDGKVGPPYSPHDLASKQRLAEVRIKDQVPPGFKDATKPGNEKFGDVIVWFQMLDHAKDEKRPVILVSGDLKEDWWWRERGKTIGPRPELRREALDVAGASFYMYTTERFLESARKHLGSNVTDEAIAEAREIQEQPDELRSARILNPMFKRSSVNLGFPSGSHIAYKDALRNLFLHTTAQSAYEDVIRKINLELPSPSDTTYDDAWRDLLLNAKRQPAVQDLGLLLGQLGIDVPETSDQGAPMEQHDSGIQRAEDEPAEADSASDDDAD